MTTERVPGETEGGEIALPHVERRTVIEVPGGFKRAGRAASP